MWIWFVVGCICGAFLGVFVVAVCTAADDEEDNDGE